MFFFFQRLVHFSTEKYMRHLTKKQGMAKLEECVVGLAMRCWENVTGTENMPALWEKQKKHPSDLLWKILREM